MQSNAGRLTANDLTSVIKTRWSHMMRFDHVFMVIEVVGGNFG